MSRRRPRRAAFTLIEVLLVLVILVILGSLVGVQMRGAQKKAQRSAAKIQVNNFDGPLGLYVQDMGNYPSTAAGLEALRTAPGEAQGQGTKWAGPYLDKNVPVDPWNRPYQYASPGRHNPDGYDVWSLGPDGADGTADDIGNWE
jgi:general secretion pathway protein G